MLLWAMCVAMGSTLVTIDDIPNPRSGGGWIADTADIIPADAEQRMNTRIDGVHAQTDAEITVVTVHDIRGVPKDFATALFNRWRVGDDEANNGLLLLLVLGQRRIEMETGYGLEAVLSDGWLGSMQTQDMVPQFKQENYAQGLEDGLDRIADRLIEQADTVRRGASGTTRSGSRGANGVLPGQGGEFLWTVLGVGFLLLIAVLVPVLIYRYNRRCQGCDTPMVLLSEAEEDEHLDEGEQVEERIGSVEWSVYQCAQCGTVRCLSNRAWLKPFGKCQKCGYRTAKKEEDVLQHATEYSGGEVRVTLTCAHCGKVYTHRYQTAATGSSSSYGGSDSFGGGSSGGGGSFGGGSSGGGGAGSSW